MVTCACGEEFEPASKEDAGISGDQITFPCPSCGRRVFFSFDKVSESLDMSKEEVKALRDKLKGERQEEETEELEKDEEPLFPDPKKKLADELENFFARLNDEFGFGIKDRFIQLMSSEIEDSGELPYPSEFKDLLKQANSGISNEYEISIITKKYNAWLQEHQREIGKLPSEGGMKVESTEPFEGGIKVGETNLPPELQEIVRERRKKKKVEDRRRELGIDRIEQQLSQITKALSKGGNKGESEGKSKSEELVYDGLKFQILRDLQNGNLGGQSNPLGNFYSTIGSIGEKAIERFADLSPALTSLLSMMESKDRAVNALIAKEIGIEPDKLISEREAVSWNAIQQKRKESEEAGEDVEREEGKRDLREIMKKQQGR